MCVRGAGWKEKVLKLRRIGENQKDHEADVCMCEDML